MTTMVNYTLYRQEHRPLEEELVESWGAISQPGHVYCTLAAYLIFILFVGPRMMAQRKPFDLKRPIMIYNIFQIVWNIYIIYLYYELMGTKSLKVWENVCYPISAAQNFRPGTSTKLAEGMKVYYVNKLVDLMDTVFFILRKKNSQITFLHMFHHVTMVASTYISVMVVREEISAVIATLNAVVHVIMYAYYFLASFGPHMQKYLWWKKYLTTFQIGQFLVQLVVLSLLKIEKCEIDPKFFMIWAFNIASFLALFVNFYRESYKKRAKIA
ncbi:elongation of very long chain fatty acids protein [Nesidiocoris tenuis]|uniref:Elongation of very long chain fatty acids protein n=1 Tax=Nesidiocoris tenuis TaxID=355587 RepID=A0ABN7B181_9HEMI|nr:elongation of very long chain fatty acids protein [Nesidiocoris tenuis]